ncbi:MAG: carbamoyltransferase HypF [Nitrospirae bacterium]|nr:MAG: carbamoyltransferase HypF [Nitrospirota bacterium]
MTHRLNEAGRQSPSSPDQRLRLEVSGRVQGVGFRPFVWQLAHALGLEGWVENTPQGVTIEVQGPAPAVSAFHDRLLTQAPPSAWIQACSTSLVPLEPQRGFTVRPSQSQGSRQSVIPPDLATCRDCLAEIMDPSSRWYRYPFTTCTQCGPRYSVVEALPYDRCNTTMKMFPLCSNCQEAYDDMANRRFHAEAIACPTCGPQVAFWDQAGRVLAEQDEALHLACEVINQGGIVAVKGLGGFHLFVDACSEPAVLRLRVRKHRPCKPFAVLFPSLAVLEEHCCVSAEEKDVLTSPAAPIVLVRRRATSSLAPAIAPGNPSVGALLPYTPLHHLLMAELCRPVVATSGNRSDEPLVFDNHEALIRLHNIADAFLVHNRPIARPIDDSVVRLSASRPMLLRRARGYVPQPIALPTMEQEHSAPCVLAVGGQLKNTITLALPHQLLVSQHLGDLSTHEASRTFERTVQDLLKLFRVTPQVVVCDRHPDYRSTHMAYRLAEALNIPLFSVQHHHAHILACLAEHDVQPPVLGVAWDGAGYGEDGTIWGGEFFGVDHERITRVGHVRPFFLPGGEQSLREPSRVALALLYELYGEAVLAMSCPPLQVLGMERARAVVGLLRRRLNCPLTTSMGRLFDGISSLLGLCQRNTFEGEAAMALEWHAVGSTLSSLDPAYTFPLKAVPCHGEEGDSRVAPSIVQVDWRPAVKAMVHALHAGVASCDLARLFHHALVQVLDDMVRHVGLETVIMSGGVFQNRLLQDLIESSSLRQRCRVYVNEQVPPNDGGISLGQAVAALRSQKNCRLILTPLSVQSEG